MKTYRFTFLCSAQDLKMITVLAQMLQRSRSDAVRWLLRKAAEELLKTDFKSNNESGLE